MIPAIFMIQGQGHRIQCVLSLKMWEKNIYPASRLVGPGLHIYTLLLLSIQFSAIVGNELVTLGFTIPVLTEIISVIRGQAIHG